MINPIDYILLADAFADVEYSGKSCVDEIVVMAATLSGMSVTSSRSDPLLTSILQAQKTLQIEQEQPSVDILKAVRNLQVAASQGQTLSAYLLSNGILVKQGFADLSALVGFVIPSAYISPG